MGLKLHHLLVHISVWFKLVSLSPTAKFVLHIWEWLHFWLTSGLLKPYHVVSRWWTSSPLRQEPLVSAFPTVVVLSVLSFTQQPSEVWILGICSLAGTMTEITAKRVTCTAKLLTLLIIHKGCLEGAGNKPACSYSSGQVCLMQHPLRGIDKHFWYKLFWYMFPMWRSNVTRDQFRSWKCCNCISLVVYPS